MLSPAEQLATPHWQLLGGESRGTEPLLPPHCPLNYTGLSFGGGEMDLHDRRVPLPPYPSFLTAVARDCSLEPHAAFPALGPGGRGGRRMQPPDMWTQLGSQA